MTAPTLLIGVGGQGSKILARIMKKMGSDRTKRIQCVVMDTDANELKDIEKDIPGVFTIQTSPNMTVGEALNKNSFARDTWFPRNQILEGKSMTEGAGQVRAISRLALEQTIINGGLTPLHDAIGELQLLSADNYVQSVRVIVCGSIAGGTGSGMFLPLGLYLRNYLKRECNLKGVNIRGFFLLPDILGNTVLADNHDQRENMRANAYAALRELDAFEGKADGDDLSAYPAVELDIPRTASDEREMYPAILPYDHVFLMDYRNTNGNTLVDMDAYLQYAADTIYSFAISPISRQSNSSEDNEIRRIANMGKNGHCRYAAAGSAEIVYPMDIIAEYVALNWAKESIGEEWVELDRILKADRKRAASQGEEFDYAAAYVNYFDDKIARGASPFYKSLQHQSLGTMKTEAGEEEQIVETITLWPQSGRVGKTSAQQSDDSGEAPADASAAPEKKKKRQKRNTTLAPVEVDGDLSGKYLAAIRASARELLEKADSFKKATDEFAAARKRLINWSETSIVAACTGYEEQIQSYHDKMLALVPDIAKRIAGQVFAFSVERVSSEEPTERDLEFWLRRAGTKEIIHPNAARYTIYKAQKTVERTLKQYSNICEVLDKQIRDDLNKDFDPADDSVDTATQAIIAALNATSGRKGIGKAVELLVADKEMEQKKQQNITSIVQFELGIGRKLESWIEARLMLEVCDEAYTYLSSLSESFEEFYTFIESQIPHIDTKIQAIESNPLYNAHSVEKNGVMGSSTRYVCADALSLGCIMRQAVREGNSASLEGEVTSAIFHSVLRRAERKRNDLKMYGLEAKREAKTLSERRKQEQAARNQRELFFGDVFDDSILGYWVKQVITGDSASLIDIDIIDAIRKEAEYCGHVTQEDVFNYVKSVLASGRILSEVFLPTASADRLAVTLYDRELIDPYDEEKKRLLGQDVLGGSVVADSDPNLNTQQILFYQSAYGITVKSLPQFVVPLDAEHDDYKGLDGTERGQYYSAYYALIRNLTDNLNQGHYISPHVDSRWHLAFQFPDIDENEGRRQRYNVVRAFVYGVLFSRIVAKEDAGSGYVYKVSLQGKERDLSVSDFKCDEFYEIFEALMMNNKLVYELLEDCDRNRDDERTLGSQGKSVLADNLRSKALGCELEEEHTFFTIDSEEKLPGVKGITSIYEIPLFYEITRPASVKHGEFISEIVESEQEVIFSYLTFLANKNDLHNVVADFFIEQYIRFRKTVEALVELKPNVRYCDTISETRMKLDYWISSNSSLMASQYVDRWVEIKHDEDRAAQAEREKRRAAKKNA